MKFRICLIAISSIFIFGCHSAKKFRSIRCVYDKDAQYRPGGSVPFGVVAIDKNNKKVITKGFLKGKYNIDNYTVTVTGGWQDGGVIFIDTTDDLIVNRSVKVLVQPVKKPSLIDSFEFSLNYEGIVTWNFSGEPGEKGKSKGARVLPIRIAGTAIADGKTGDDGLTGNNGQDVTVYVYKVHDDSFSSRFGYDLYAVKSVSQNGGNIKLTFIAEKYGKLILKSNGGNGGNGGDGGRGANGFDENSNGNTGEGTDGGQGGSGGVGGNGGRIQIFIDTGARDFVKYLDVQNGAGKGGLGGAGGAGGTGGTRKDGTKTSDGKKGLSGISGVVGKDGPPVEILYDYIRF